METFNACALFLDYPFVFACHVLCLIYTAPFFVLINSY